MGPAVVLFLVFGFSIAFAEPTKTCAFIAEQFVHPYDRVNENHIVRVSGIGTGTYNFEIFDFSGKLKKKILGADIQVHDYDVVIDQKLDREGKQFLEIHDLNSLKTSRFHPGVAQIPLANWHIRNVQRSDEILKVSLIDPSNRQRLDLRVTTDGEIIPKEAFLFSKLKDSNKLLLEVPDSSGYHTKLYDLKTKKYDYSLPQDIDYASIYRAYENLFRTREATVIKTPNSGWKRIADSNTTSVQSQLPSGDWIVWRRGSSRDDWHSEIFDPEVKRSKSKWKGQLRYENDHVLQGDDHRIHIYSANQVSNRKVLDDEPRPRISIDRGGSFDSTIVSESGKWLWWSGQRGVVRLSDGKHFDLNPDQRRGFKESPDGKRLLIEGNQILDLETGTTQKVASKNARVLADKELKNFLIDQDIVKENCFSSSIKIVEDSCDCLLGDNGERAFKDSLASLQNISLQALCQADFKRSEWDKLTPNIESGNISESRALLYLKRFQKFGGFEPNRHQPILVSILQSKIVNEKPAEIERVFQNLMLNHPELAFSLYRTFDLERRLKFDGTTADQCASPAELEAKRKVIEGFRSLASDPNATTNRNTWLEYLPFRQDFPFNESQRTAMIDNIAESLARTARNESPHLAGLAGSELYYFAKKHALHIMGESSKPSSYLFISQSGSDKVPVILSSDRFRNSGDREIINAKESHPGFYHQTLAPLDKMKSSPVGESKTQSISWQTDSEVRQAELTTRRTDELAQTVEKSASPDYNAIKTNDVMTGLIAVGSNTAHEPQVVTNYIYYFHKRGFKFFEHDDVNSLEFMRQAISSGEVGYTIKEAHFSADSQNMMRVHEKSKLLRADLRDENGKLREQIFIMSPTDRDHVKSVGTQMISQADLGKWIRARPGDKKMIYINGSCKSYSQIIGEIAATESKKLIPIATTTNADGFYPDERNGMFHVLEGIRNERSYAEIRRGLHESAAYKRGNDHYIFPDEQAYDTQVRQALDTNIEVSVKVRDSKGKIVEIDREIE